MLQEVMKEPLSQGSAPGGPTGRCVDFNNISCNTVKDFSMEYFNFHEEGTLRRV
jgi:hypothetical protein